ncbi:hypothetical protein, partial [Cohnella yongneupensis]
MKIRRKISRGIARKTNIIVSMAMVLTQQISPFIHQASAKSSDYTPVTYLTIPIGKKFKMDIADQYILQANGYNGAIISITSSAGNVLTIEPLKEGSTFLSLTFNDNSGSVTQTFVINVVDSGADKTLDIGDIVKYLNANTSSLLVSDISNMLNNLGPVLYPASSSVVINYAPIALQSQSVFVYNPTSVVYVSNVDSLYSSFFDANGTSDLVGFNIVQAPNPASGVSVSIDGTTLHLGGTPTMPASFKVRATDSQGLFADMTYKVNFTPESLGAQPTIAITGSPTTVDLSSYFIDRDGDALTYLLAGVEGVGHWAAISGSVLSVWGDATLPAQVIVGASDGYYTAINTVSFAGQNVAPEALSSQSVFVYNPTSAVYASGVSSLYSSFYDANGTSDLVGFMLVQAPNPASGVSVSINGSTLHLGGTPTMPASFVVRATDSAGQFADQTYKVNFMPESLGAQPTIAITGSPTTVDLSSYFIDRDGDALTYFLAGMEGVGHWVAISGSVLSVWGDATLPAQVIVGASDGFSYYTALNTVSFAGQNVAPEALSSQSVFVYNPTSAVYASSVDNLYSSFFDANGTSDIVGFTIIQAPNPASGVSVSINGSTLHLGGTPTMPASFKVRATDSQGLYADKTYAINFTPEAVARPAVYPSGVFVSVDLSSYFTDRDGDSLNYYVTPIDDEHSIWISGSILNVWSESVAPYQLQIGASDGFSYYTALNTVSFAGQNVAPEALSSQSVFVYNPTSAVYASSIDNLYSSFFDANGTSDIVGFTIIQAPNPASGVSVSINGSTLHLGGTPTMPASFKVRATDSQGLYADKTYAINFTPEAVAGPAVYPSGVFVSVDLSSYFTDR